MKNQYTTKKIKKLILFCFILIVVAASWIFAYIKISKLNAQVEILQLGNSAILEKTQAFERNNPIDAFFDTFEWEGRGSTLEMRTYANMYREAWYEEMVYAYNLLYESANPYLETPRLEIIHSRDNFIEYVKNESQVYAYFENSNAFGDEFNGEHTKSISTGTIFPATASIIASELYKKKTLEIYEKLNSLKNLDTDIKFIFIPTKEVEGFFNGNYDAE
ncbi:hypothetical protein [Lacrimispora sp.]|uniref:hypothetical protein n=1 Tax=Lacrimispora sp. TaxID=2719234 RepID=UPI0028ABF1F5|nr:hypothetical protein [Lacrimispora sp.]